MFSKAKNAAAGVVFEDKNGKLFKVAVAGADPVVSDGDQYLKMPGELNLKVVDKPFDDHTGPVPVEIAVGQGSHTDVLDALTGGKPAVEANIDHHADADSLVVGSMALHPGAKTLLADNSTVKLPLSAMKRGTPVVLADGPNAIPQIVLGPDPDDPGKVWVHSLAGAVYRVDGDAWPDKAGTGQLPGYGEVKTDFVKAGNLGSFDDLKPGDFYIAGGLSATGPHALVLDVAEGAEPRVDGDAARRRPDPEGAPEARGGVAGAGGVGAHAGRPDAGAERGRGEGLGIPTSATGSSRTASRGRSRTSGAAARASSTRSPMTAARRRRSRASTRSCRSRRRAPRRPPRPCAYGLTPNTTPVGDLAIGSLVQNQPIEARPDPAIWKLTGKQGTNATLELVKQSSGPGIKTKLGETLTADVSEVFDLAGPPVADSPDLGDYDVLSNTQLGNLAVGEYFKSATGKVFKVGETVTVGDATQTKVTNLATGKVAYGAPSMAVTTLKPKPGPVPALVPEPHPSGYEVGDTVTWESDGKPKIGKVTGYEGGPGTTSRSRAKRPRTRASTSWAPRTWRRSPRRRTPRRRTTRTPGRCAAMCRRTSSTPARCSSTRATTGS